MKASFSPTCFSTPRAIPLAALVFALGCGSNQPLARVSGTVTFEGQPLEQGVLVFSNERQGVYITVDIEDGQYEVVTSQGKGLPPGHYLVAITPPRIDHPVGPILERPKPSAHDDIPPRYRDERTSGLAVQLNEGENVASFSMTPP